MERERAGATCRASVVLSCGPATPWENVRRAFRNWDLFQRTIWWSEKGPIGHSPPGSHVRARLLPQALVTYKCSHSFTVLNCLACRALAAAPGPAPGMRQPAQDERDGDRQRHRGGQSRGNCLLRAPPGHLLPFHSHPSPATRFHGHNHHVWNYSHSGPAGSGRKGRKVGAAFTLVKGEQDGGPRWQGWGLISWACAHGHENVLAGRITGMRHWLVPSSDPFLCAAPLVARDPPSMQPSTHCGDCHPTQPGHCPCISRIVSGLSVGNAGACPCQQLEASAGPAWASPSRARAAGLVWIPFRQRGFLAPMQMRHLLRTLSAHHCDNGGQL